MEVVFKMAMNREKLYRLVDAIPSSEWHDVERYLKIKAVPQEEATEEELEIIKQAETEYLNGESVSYTADEFKKRFLYE